MKYVAKKKVHNIKTSILNDNTVVTCSHYTHGSAILCPSCNKYFLYHKCHDTYNYLIMEAKKHNKICKLYFTEYTERIKINLVISLKCNTLYTLYNLLKIDTSIDKFRICTMRVV